MTTTARPAASGRSGQRPGILGAAALAAGVADELVVGTVRDVHGAVSHRVRRLTGRPATVAGPGRVSAGIYAGIGAGLGGTSRLLRAADRRGLGPRLEADPRGRFVVSAVNGFIGDRLAEEHPDLAIEMSVRRHGQDVPCSSRDLAAAFPDATGEIVVFLHGLGESDDAWRHRVAETGGT